MKTLPFIALFHCVSFVKVSAFVAHTVDKRLASRTEARYHHFHAKALETSQVSIEYFAYDGWNLTYQHKPASDGYEQHNPILLVHPVGIGLSSWFWNQLMRIWEGPELLAIDLIGCGVQHGADAWDPDMRGLSIPLGWTKCCEALMDHADAKTFSVVVQGGLGPVGVLLASRNPLKVKKLVLTSPPTWEAMTTGVPETELATNYKFFRSPVLGRLAFQVLESRWAVRFFSNLFLFAKPCDDTWLDEVEKEACEESRPPVQVFNSGFCLHRSYEEELRSLDQPVLIVQGKEDETRIPKRNDYSSAMKNCSLETIQGRNVLPWEFPQDSAECIKRFLL